MKVANVAKNGCVDVFKIQTRLILGAGASGYRLSVTAPTKENTLTPHRDINEDEWERVMPLFPELRQRTELRGRPLANTRSVLNGVLWVMYSGATWSAMPRRYPSYQTCHRRFKAWYDDGVLKRVMAELFGDEGAVVCHAFESRMRKPMNRAGKGMRNEQPPVKKGSPFGPVTSTGTPPFPTHRLLFRPSS